MALKSCRSCGHFGLFALLLVGMCAFPTLSAEDSSRWIRKPDESMIEWDRRLDTSVRERIGCLDPSFLVRAIVAEGSYELIALDQSRITMCGGRRTCLKCLWWIVPGASSRKSTVGR